MSNETNNHNPKINGVRFNRGAVTAMKNFNEFYDSQKNSAYVNYKAATPDKAAEADDPAAQKKLLAAAWNVMRPNDQVDEFGNSVVAEKPLAPLLPEAPVVEDPEAPEAPEAPEKPKTNRK